MEPDQSNHVGSFLFTLGYLAKGAGLELSRRPVDLPFGAADHVGDLARSWGGRTFILEFKRNEETVMEEFRRPHKRRLLDRLKSPEGAAMRGLSRRGHFIAYGVSDSRMAGLVFMRYFEAADSPSQTGAHLGMGTFFTGVITNRKGGMSNEEFDGYVAELAAICRAAPPDPAKVVPAGPPELPSLIVNFDATSRHVRFRTVDLLRGS